MLFIFRKNRILFEKICEYLDLTEIVFGTYQKIIKHFLKHGIDSKYSVLMERINKEESDADKLLVIIKTQLYKKSLLPESREDVLVLLEKVDDIVDLANHTIQFLYSHNAIVPDFLEKDFKELIKLSIESFHIIVDSVKELFKNSKNIIANIRKTDNFESICDTLQLTMIKKIFNSDLDSINKIVSRDVIKTIGSISDACEDVGDKIIILSIKRAV